MFTINENSLPRTRQEAYEFSVAQGLIPSAPYCRTKCKGHSNHGGLFSHYYDTETGLGRYRCSKRNKCRSDITVATGTWFENSRLSVEKELRLLFGYAHDESYERVALGVNDHERPTVSTATIADRFKYCRQMIVCAFTKLQETLPKIGGPGVIVQIDESKFGKRKYNRGRIVEGHWVLGMIAQNSEDLRLVVCPDNKRDGATLINVIRTHVHVGSVIHTDEWRGYNALPNHGYIHHTVNHSMEFIASGGTNTQRIESQWSALKKYFKGKEIRNEEFADKICEYLWRRYGKKNKIDPMENLLSCIRMEYGDFRE